MEQLRKQVTFPLMGFNLKISGCSGMCGGSLSIEEGHETLILIANRERILNGEVQGVKWFGDAEKKKVQTSSLLAVNWFQKREYEKLLRLNGIFEIDKGSLKVPPKIKPLVVDGLPAIVYGYYFEASSCTSLVEELSGLYRYNTEFKNWCDSSSEKVPLRS